MINIDFSLIPIWVYIIAGILAVITISFVIKLVIGGVKNFFYTIFTLAGLAGIAYLLMTFGM